MNTNDKVLELIKFSLMNQDLIQNTLIKDPKRTSRQSGSYDIFIDSIGCNKDVVIRYSTFIHYFELNVRFTYNPWYPKECITKISCKDNPYYSSMYYKAGSTEIIINGVREELSLSEEILFSKSLVLDNTDYCLYNLVHMLKSNNIEVNVSCVYPKNMDILDLDLEKFYKLFGRFNVKPQ